ncbi:MAG: gamma-glutamyl-gamma-aminobutyrate hydrolase family protein [Candidatus Gastranaerophilales bacterium]|nr:gamma-glutamyl-gamma-aminobutyrate hydrolase family protein [Candidatus Gastranaerophilales bacterium]
MKALITQREVTDSYNVKCDMLESTYIPYFESIGINAVPVSNFQTVTDIDTDLIILTGGGSIAKEQPNRDKTEKELFELAISKNLPILAICRGFQYINYLLGGKISKLDNLKIKRDIGKDHFVSIKNEKILVNNYHNDGIYTKDLAKGLKILALDEENDTVEAFTSEKYRILAVQWHPERKFSDEKSRGDTKNLIKKFINGEEL